ncbi:hypothetical protein AAFF_G00127080 [Aldrovandia affinis]|uniref:Uncharacterized protein n=1 Tax=Aldrovandia affinis TaxID=143900 RepID=A0AAD7T236_9TELE|nr:hypothetical protein AAFF_G00127080 [Aldrovandia affinis]
MAVGKRQWDSAVRKPLSQEPILLNQEQPTVPETSLVPLTKRAKWHLEELQECNFQIKHRAGRHHTNAVLSRRPCAELDCWHCHRQEEKSQVEPEVAAVHTISKAGWLPVSPEQLREGQEADGTLQKVRGWLEAGRPPQ